MSKLLAGDRDQPSAPGTLTAAYEAAAHGLGLRLTGPNGSTETLRPKAEPGDDLDGAWWLDFLRGNEAVYPPGRPAIGVVDLFCGVGGLSLGASLAASGLGFKIEHDFAADIDPQALGVYRANHRPRFFANESVSNLVGFRIDRSRGHANYAHKPEILDERLAMLSGQIDLLLAGPPCQGHSTANNHTRFNDPRNLLYLAAPAVAIGLDVPAVIIENVPGVTASREGVVRTALELLSSNGYSVSSRVLRSDDLGWPQTRRRFFMVATRGWEPVPLDEVVKSLERTARPVSWALEELLDRDEGTVMTDTPVMSDENRARIDHLHDNGLYDLPNEHRPDSHKNGTTYKAVYGRMRWDRPAPTLTTGFMTPGRGRYIHPLRRRTLLPREAARLQGFPDDFRFETPSETLGRSAIAKGIGDAVPSILGYAATLSALGNRPRT